MNERETIARLRELRRLREQRASESVTRRHGALNKAKGEVEKAARATEALLQAAAVTERAEFGSLVGQSVDVHHIHRLQGLFQKKSDDLVRLRDLEQRAAATERQCRDHLAKAREGHKVRMRAVAKLDVVLEQLLSRPMKGGATRAELVEEESVAEHSPAKRNGRI